MTNSNLTRRQLVTNGLALIGGAAALTYPSSILRLDFLSEGETQLDPGFVPFRHPLADGGGFRGGEASIALDLRNGRVRKQYSVDGVTASGHLPTHNWEEASTELYRTEKSAFQKLNALGSRHTAQLIGFNDQERTLTLPYLGPDLCVRMVQEDWSPSQDQLMQIAELYEEYRNAGLLNRNLSRPNLYWSQGRIVSADLKWVGERNLSNFAWEVQQIHLHLAQIDKSLPCLVRETFSDYPSEIVDAAFGMAGRFEWTAENRFDQQVRMERNRLLVDLISQVGGTEIEMFA